MDNLKQVTDFVIKNCYPGLGSGDYLKFFEKMVEDSALLVAKWMTVGFAHGVLKTFRQLSKLELTDGLKTDFDSVNKYLSKFIIYLNVNTKLFFFLFQVFFAGK